MHRRQFMLPGSILILPVLLTLLFSIACGGSTQPTAAPAPQAAATAMPTLAQAAATTMPTLALVPPTAAATSAPVVAEEMITSTTKRLVISLGPLSTETNLPWDGPSIGWDKRHLYENLIGVERSTGQLIPEIANEWSVSPDALTWTFNLRDDVPFHFGLGNVTSHDVKHMIAMSSREDALANEKKPYNKTIREVEIVDEQTVKIHQLKADGFTVPFFNYGGHGGSVVSSKDQWDAGGDEGYIERPTGTGSYRYVSREPSQSILAERVEDHWRKTAEFEELEVVFTAEEATRLATLLTGQAHIVSLPKDLQQTALDEGMTMAESVLPAVQVSSFFSGQWYSTPELMKNEPWAGEDENSRKVRQAINKAINRQELLDEIMLGRAEMIRVWGYHSSLVGWNPDWETQWEEMYGYDPVRARELLDEAGYPNGFKLSLNMSASSSVPEQLQLHEAVGLYLEDVGIEVEFTAITGAQRSKMRRNREWNDLIFAVSGTYRDPQFTVRTYNDHAEGTVHAYENDFIHAAYQELTAAATPEDRYSALLKMGNHKFENFAEIPMFWFQSAVMMDPDVVQEYIYPGNRRQIQTHFEFIKAAN